MKTHFVKGIMIFAISIIHFSCNSNETSETITDGAIWNTGNYYLRDVDLTLEIYLENNLVRYRAIDNKKKEVIRYQNDISTLHKWAFFFDKEKTLWVLSSDVGHTYWKYDTLSKKYSYHELEYLFDKNTVPDEVRNAMKDKFRNLQ